MWLFQRFSFAAIVILVVGGLSPICMAQPTWTPARTLNNNATIDDKDDFLSDIVMDRTGTAIAVWTVRTPSSGPTYTGQIATARSVDGGESWSPLTQIDPTTSTHSGQDAAGTVAGDGEGNWVLTWYSDKDVLDAGSDFDVFFSRSSDNGATWSSPALLDPTHATGDYRYDGLPAVSHDGNGAWVVAWTTQQDWDGNGFDGDLVVARSYDNGETWTVPAPLNLDAYTDERFDNNGDLVTDGAGNWLSILSSQERIGGSLVDTDLYVARSVDDGVTWTLPRPMNPYAYSDAGDDVLPELKTDHRGRWVSVWFSDSNVANTGTDPDVYFSLSDDNGDSWSDPLPIDSGAYSDTHYDTNVAVDTDGAGTWVAVWSSSQLSGQTSQESDIFYAISVDNGATWSDPAPVNDYALTDRESDYSPRVATDGSGHWIVGWGTWESHLDSGEDSDTFYATAFVAPLSEDPCVAADTAPPLVACTNLTLQLGAGEYVEVSAFDVDKGSMDDCGIASRHLSREVFTCADLGTHPVTLTVTDLRGNVSSCQATVTVIDLGYHCAEEGPSENVWTSPQALNSNAAFDAIHDSSVSLANDGLGNWVAAWYSAQAIPDAGTDADIFVSRSSDNGATWSDVQLLNASGIDDERADRVPQVVTDNQGVWLAVWHSNADILGSGLDREILLSRSEDNGATWSYPTLLDRYAQTDEGSDHHPALDTDGNGNWIVTWESSDSRLNAGRDYDIYFVRSTDNGLTWTSPRLLNDDGYDDTYQELRPSVASNGANVWIAVWASQEQPVFVWKDDNGQQTGADSDIFFARSVDYGASWSQPQVLNSNAGSDSETDRLPHVASDGGRNWVVVWESEEDLNGAGGDFDIFVCRSGDNGATWSAPQPLNETSAMGFKADYRPRVCSDGNGTWMATWYSAEPMYDGDTDYDVVASYSSNNGATWTTPALVMIDDGDMSGERLPAIATDRNGKWIAAWNSVNEGGELGDDADILFASTFLEAVVEGEGYSGELHSADLDANGRIELPELLRVVQLYSVQDLHCDATTEDGYAPGVGDTSCSPHDSDFSPTDWRIGMSELLRAIQFYNASGYYHCPDSGTEDGFCVAYE